MSTRTSASPAIALQDLGVIRIDSADETRWRFLVELAEKQVDGERPDVLINWTEQYGHEIGVHWHDESRDRYGNGPTFTAALEMLMARVNEAK